MNAWKLKSYFAGTVEAALGLAREELGPDALLVNSRRATRELRYLGEYEVVFALDGSAPVPEHAPEATADWRSADRIAKEMAELRRQVGSLLEWISGSPDRTVPEPLEDSARLALERTGLTADCIRTILSACPGVATANWRSALRAELTAHLRTDSTVAPIVAVVGPPGSGKSSVLLKLAARYGLTSRRPAQILSCDTFRVGASEPLRSAAAIFGLGFQVSESVHALSQAIREHAEKGRIFIDTPGLAAAEMQAASQLGVFFGANPAVAVHLVVPASMRPSDLAAAVDRYRGLHPSRIVFTRLDETSSYGTLYEESERCGLPVSFLTSGTRIPEDLEPATPERLADLIVDGAESAAAVAA